MRIWGGSWITMSSIYGGILHPFMDWYLINPVFSYEPKKLENGKYQQKIINYFAPQLNKLPINATSKIDSHYRGTKKRIKHYIEKYDLLSKTSKDLYSLVSNDRSVQNSPNSSPNRFPDINNSFFTDLNIDRSMLQNLADSNTISRIHSVSSFQEYIQNESSKLNGE